jgi:CubicO group peptidase (beta-lactamase class C family)
MRPCKSLALSFVVFFAFLANLAAQDLPTAKPAEVGLSAERLDRITQWLSAESAKGTIPGAITMVVRDGKVAYFEAVGVLDPESKAPMTKDAIFRIYSMTKPITSVAIMMLLEQGKLMLEDPVAKYIAAFKDVKVGVESKGEDGKPKLELVDAKRPMTIQDLLRHSSGLTYGIFGNTLVKTAYQDGNVIDYKLNNAQFAARLAKLPLAFQPGTTWDYSHATDILGRVVEVVSGNSLYQFQKENILDPLGMSDTSYYVTDKAKHSRIAESFKDDRKFGTNIEFNDPRLAEPWESGGGGMVGTVADYARFLTMLTNGGTFNGKRILGPKTIAYMTGDHMGSVITPGPLYLPGPGYSFGLGFAVRKEAGVATSQGSVGDYNWGGAGGTYFWVDPKENMFVVFAMQSPRNRAAFRPILRNLEYSAIEKPRTAD